MNPAFQVGQRVRVKRSAFVEHPRRGVIAKVQPNYSGQMLLYWLTDGGVFSACELEAA